MLWLALHLPLLSLESFAALLPGHVPEQPLALADAQGIASANAAARALGIAPGLKRATALALAPQLVLGQADAARDAQALAAVAHAALAFTPVVTLQPPGHGRAGADTVLLEVQASLRHFGGPERRLEPLLQRLRVALAPLGHAVRIASAPTPLGAALLARAPAPQGELHCTELKALRALLDAAPVWLLGPGREHWDALQGMACARSVTCCGCRAPASHAASARPCSTSWTVPAASGPTRASRSSRPRLSRAASSSSPAPTPPSRCCTAPRCCLHAWWRGSRPSMRTCAGSRS